VYMTQSGRSDLPSHCVGHPYRQVGEGEGVIFAHVEIKCMQRMLPPLYKSASVMISVRNQDIFGTCGNNVFASKIL
jgi:hypothetical protein